MQSAPAMQWPGLCPAFLRELRDAQHSHEHAVMQALGCGTRGFTCPSLPPTERSRLIELVRYSLVCNLYGDQLCMPFAGGEKRSRSGAIMGVRAASVQGFAGSNLQAMLQGADAYAAFRDRYPELLLTISMEIFNTNDLELGFSLLWQACNGCKPEVVQLEAQGRRLEFLEDISMDPDVPIEIKRRKKAAGKYSGSVKEREKRRERENLIDNTDPNSAGSIEFLTKKHRTARQGATATNEMIRSQWQDKGIGKLGQ